MGEERVRAPSAPATCLRREPKATEGKHCSRLASPFLRRNFRNWNRPTGIERAERAGAGAPRHPRPADSCVARYEVGSTPFRFPPAGRGEGSQPFCSEGHGPRRGLGSSSEVPVLHPHARVREEDAPSRPHPALRRAPPETVGGGRTGSHTR